MLNAAESSTALKLLNNVCFVRKVVILLIIARVVKVEYEVIPSFETRVLPNESSYLTNQYGIPLYIYSNDQPNESLLINNKHIPFLSSTIPKITYTNITYKQLKSTFEHLLDPSKISFIKTQNNHSNQNKYHIAYNSRPLYINPLDTPGTFISQMTLKDAFNPKSGRFILISPTGKPNFSVFSIDKALQQSIDETYIFVAGFRYGIDFLVEGPKRRMLFQSMNDSLLQSNCVTDECKLHFEQIPVSYSTFQLLKLRFNISMFANVDGFLYFNGWPLYYNRFNEDVHLRNIDGGLWFLTNITGEFNFEMSVNAIVPVIREINFGKDFYSVVCELGLDWLLV